MLTEIVQYEDDEHQNGNCDDLKLDFCAIFFIHLHFYCALRKLASLLKKFSLCSFWVIFVVNKPSKLVFPPIYETSRELFCVVEKKFGQKPLTRSHIAIRRITKWKKKINFVIYEAWKKVARSGEEESS